jgi:hypothetical protein
VSDQQTVLHLVSDRSGEQHKGGVDPRKKLQPLPNRTRGGSQNSEESDLMHILAWLVEQDGIDLDAIDNRGLTAASKATLHGSLDGA